MTHINVSDGTPIYYIDQGSGPTVVLLHGLMLTVDGFWTRNIDALSKTCRVIAIDHRSHGQSGKPYGPHSIKQCAADLKDVLERLDLKNVTLGGVAFGAMVVLEYLRHYGTDRLSKLAIVEAQVRLVNTEGWEHPTFGNFPAEAGAGFVEACRQSRDTLVDFLAGEFGTPPAADEMARMQTQAWLTPTHAVIEYVEEMLAADYRADLARITLPTLLIYGRRNNVPMPTEIGQWVADQIPDARLELLTESGHSPFYEDAKRFNQCLADFVNG